MDYYIHPLKGVNEIAFGMSRFQARRHMGSSAELVRRGGEGVPSDYFVDEGIFFEYDDKETLSAIEITRGSRLLLHAQSVFDLDVEQCFAFLKLIDPYTILDDDGVTSHSLSIGVWVPFMEADEDDDGEYDYDGYGKPGQIESIMIGRLGYFDFRKDLTTGVL